MTYCISVAVQIRRLAIDPHDFVNHCVRGSVLISEACIGCKAMYRGQCLSNALLFNQFWEDCVESYPQSPLLHTAFTMVKTADHEFCIYHCTDS